MGNRFKPPGSVTHKRNIIKTLTTTLNYHSKVDHELQPYFHQNERLDINTGLYGQPSVRRGRRDRLQRVKIMFLKENGVCFDCLCKGHISKDYRERHSCNICSLKHRKMQHIHQKRKEMDKEQAEIKKGAKDTAVASVKASGLSGVDEDNCKRSVVPVQVKAKKGNMTVHTCAFLGPNSTASFCTVGLMNKLNLQGKRSSIVLQTMEQRKVVETSIISGLEVSGLDNNDFVICQAYTLRKLCPCTKETSHIKITGLI